MQIIERLVPPAPTKESTERLAQKRAEARAKHGKAFAADRGSSFEPQTVPVLTQHFARLHAGKEGR